MVAATAAGVSGYTVKDLVGDPNAEALKAALSYLIQNGRTLIAFACHNPQLQAWLEWLIADRTQPRRPQATGLEGAGRQAVSAARQPAEHRLHRFDAWAAAAMSPPSHVSPY